MDPLQRRQHAAREHRTPGSDALTRSDGPKPDDLTTQRRRASAPGAALGWASGLWSTGDARTIDVAAGAALRGTGDAGLFVVSDGVGGHSTGWLGARFAVRTLLDRLAGGATPPCLEGAADLIPDGWGWAGAMQSREAGEALYASCVAALGELSALPTDLPSLFAVIDGVIATLPMRTRLSGLLVGCTAAILEGTKLHGAHVGVGRASLLRAGASSFAELVVPHYLHTIAQRTAALRGLDLATLPRNILCNGLGGLVSAELGVDGFAAELGPGDCMLLASNPIELEDAELVRVLRADAPLAERARALERTLAGVSSQRQREVAFVLVGREPG